MKLGGEGFRETIAVRLVDSFEIGSARWPEFHKAKWSRNFGNVLAVLLC